MAAKTWEKDFRFPAIQASIRAVSDAYDDDPFKYPGSFCLPVAERPLVGWTFGRIGLIIIIVGIALVVGGIALLAEFSDTSRPDFWMMLAAGLGILIVGLFVCLIPVKFDRPFLCWLMGDRARQLKERDGAMKVMSAELTSPIARNLMSIDGDDHVLILFDETNRRLLMEGMGARYQIRESDVRMIAPFRWMNYTGVELLFRIDAQTELRVAMARISLLESLGSDSLLTIFLRKFFPDKLLRNCERILGSSD